MECRHCGAENTDQARFCQACGKSFAPESKSCGNCGAVNSGTAVYCINCGKALEPIATPAALWSSSGTKVPEEVKTLDPPAAKSTRSATPSTGDTADHKVAALCIWAVGAIPLGAAIFFYTNSDDVINASLRAGGPAVGGRNPLVGIICFVMFIFFAKLGKHYWSKK